MDNKFMTVLTCNKYYIIMARKTKKPYIDANYNCYLFNERKEAESFMAKIKEYNEDVYLSDSDKEINSAIKFSNDMNNIGVKNIVARFNKEDYIIPTEKPDFKYLLYNPVTSGNLLRLSQTSQKQYLRNLYSGTFYTAISLDKRKFGRHPIIRYSFVTIKGMGRYFILFSSLHEFYEWNKTQDNKWSPMETNISKFDRIRMGNPIIINPHLDKIVLTKSLINIIKEGKKEYDEKRKECKRLNEEKRKTDNK